MTTTYKYWLKTWVFIILFCIGCGFIMHFLSGCIQDKKPEVIRDNKLEVVKNVLPTDSLRCFLITYSTMLKPPDYTTATGQFSFTCLSFPSKKEIDSCILHGPDSFPWKKEQIQGIIILNIIEFKSLEDYNNYKK